MAVATILREVMEGVALITFNRPEVRNALNLEMIEELARVLEQYRRDPAVKVVVFTGAGDAFVSGGDLAQFGTAGGGEGVYPLLRKAADLLEQIDQYPKPTIAMINGTALGGGCELAISCHFRFASETAEIGFVQIGLHITTGWGGGSRLLDKLGEAQALTMLLTGQRFRAAEAERLGFVDAVYAPERLRAEVLAFAGKIADKPLAGIEAYLRLLAWKRSGTAREKRVQQEIVQCAGLWGSTEHIAAIQRYLPKK